MPSEAGSAAQGSPWQSSPFRLLLVGGTISSFGNAIAPVAIAFAVLALGGEASELGLVVAAYAAAQVATTLLGGVLGDWLPRGLLVRGSALACGSTQAVVALSLVQGWSSLGLLAGAGVCTGVFGALASPSLQAITAQTVPGAVLQRAISWRRLAGNGAQVIGFGLAGALVAAVGPGWAIAVDAATFFVAAGCYSLLTLPPVTPDAGRGRSIVGDISAGAREVTRHTWMWVLIAQAAVYHLFNAGAQGVLGPIVVSDAFGKAAWGWTLAMLMIGFMVGGVITLRWRPRHNLYAGTALLALTGAFPAAMALGLDLPLVLAGAFVHGLGLEIFSVAWDLSIQQNVPSELLARVFAVDIAGSFLARPIGFAVSGVVAEAVGYSRWLWAVAAVLTGTTLLCLLVPSIRRLQRTDLPGRGPRPARATGPAESPSPG